MHKFTNALVKETSPYLLQHAHNPVNWFPWNKKALQKAQKENKLLIISVGYAACHWCHVMEQESFEDEEVAKIMNKHFVNIKIDREERPDIDQVYMTAVQMISGQGGWPLNCIALPNGKPIWGGTYFSKEEWINVLQKLLQMYSKNPEKINRYAKNITEGLKKLNISQANTKTIEFRTKFLETAIKNWKNSFDTHFGGINKAPKFPMPVNYHFILRYAHQTKDKNLMKFLNTTLQKMAMGGIFDQIGGGFARYSVDKKWHIPHFEKMLYDNAQLVSLFADAYLKTKKKLYKETIKNTLAFVERELMSNFGGFYSSLDADSQNKDGILEEGAFYIFTKEELKKIIADFKIFKEYYNINSFGHWEDNKYHLIRTLTSKQFAEKHQIPKEKLKKTVQTWKKNLLKERNKKKKPRLDDKILTSWNALMLKAYCDAYRVLKKESYLKIALKNANFIEKNLYKTDDGLFRSFKNGKATINAFLEDYATLTNAYIALYQITFDEKWLLKAKQLTDYCFDHFYDTHRQTFFFTSSKDDKLIVRKIENEDNVIPSANSIMATNLFLLGNYFSNPYYLKTSKKMLHNLATEDMQKHPMAYANWLNLYLNHSNSFYQVVITGNDLLLKNKELSSFYIPNKLVAGSKTGSNLKLLKNRFVSKKTMLYVCKNNTCKLPSESVKKAVHQMTE